MPAPSIPSTGSLAIGSRIGERFLVRLFLGADELGERYACLDERSGGMSSVFRIHPEILDAVPQFEAQVESAFERRLALAQEGLLSLSALLREDGLLAFVTDYVEGTTLSEYLNEYGALFPDVAMQLFFELAEKLSQIHAQGVVLGVIDPGCILVKQEGANFVGALSPIPYGELLPFLPAMRTRLELYFAPDRRIEPGVGDDVFAFGACLLEAVAAARPQPSVLEQLHTGESIVPKDLVVLIRQCMHPRGEHRFRAMSAVRNVLHGILAAAEADSGIERPEPGDVIAEQYCIEQLLGEGGMARVYLARDNLLGTQVAIKLLNAACASDPPVVERFLNEASIQAKLVNPEAHPNIVAVHRILREAPVGYVMEYVPGFTLEDMLASRLPPESELLDIFAQICDGLHHAHEHRVIHRDLKLSNILLVQNGQRLLAKLMDFGISKQLDQPKTKTNLVLGTLGYIAPELFISAKDASVASDLYAMGCCLFECFTGDVPFSVSGGLRSLAFRVYNEEPAQPSALGAKLQRGTEAVILRCLAKKPEHRPPSAAWLAHKLRLLRDGQSDEELLTLIADLDARKKGGTQSSKLSIKEPSPLTAQSSALGKTTQRSIDAAAVRPRRSRAPLLFATIVILLVIIGGVVFVFLQQQDEPPPQPPPERAEAPPAPKPEPKPIETPPEPKPINQQPTALSTSVVLGADALFTQAEAAAQAGNRRQAAQLYLKAATKLQEEGVDEAQVASAYQKAATQFEDLAAATTEEIDNTSTISPETAAERMAALDQASQAYALAASSSGNYELFMKKAAVDQGRGDVEAAIASLQKAIDLAANEKERKSAEKQLKNISKAIDEGKDSEDTKAATEDLGPLPPNMIQVWLVTSPERADVFLGGKRVGRTPLIKRLPKTTGKLDFLLKHRGYFDEPVSIDAANGGRFDVNLKYRPPPIR
ncbi:MAG: protein kinase [Myxococcota bacterium]|jgi:serine/threonine protein kinase|nr:protein kinase [Myxococcota bacterium]